MPAEGVFKYRYIAACATDECLYVGELSTGKHSHIGMLMIRLSSSSFVFLPSPIGRRNHVLSSSQWVSYLFRIIVNRPSMLFAVDGDPGPSPILHISEIRRTGGWASLNITDDNGDAMSDVATEISDLHISDRQAIALVRPPIPCHRPQFRAYHLLNRHSNFSTSVLDLSSANIVTWDMPPQPPLSFYAMTLNLDAVIKPGVLVDDFLCSVSLCSCGILTSIRAFSAHNCQVSAKRES